jgi:hypothetical protein
VGGEECGFSGGGFWIEMFGLRELGWWEEWPFHRTLGDFRHLRRMKAFSITTGIGLILLSLIACGVSLIAIFDPVGTQMADDNAPFGSPPNRLYSVCVLCGFVAIGAAGVYLVRRSVYSKQNATNVA